MYACMHVHLNLRMPVCLFACLFVCLSAFLFAHGKPQYFDFAQVLGVAVKASVKASCGGLAAEN